MSAVRFRAVQDAGSRRKPAGFCKLVTAAKIAAEGRAVQSRSPACSRWKDLADTRWRPFLLNGRKRRKARELP